MQGATCCVYTLCAQTSSLFNSKKKKKKKKWAVTLWRLHLQLQRLTHVGMLTHSAHSFPPCVLNLVVHLTNSKPLDRGSILTNYKNSLSTAQSGFNVNSLDRSKQSLVAQVMETLATVVPTLTEFYNSNSSEQKTNWRLRIKCPTATLPLY